MLDEDPPKKTITFCLCHQSVIRESPCVENELKHCSKWPWANPHPGRFYCTLACFFNASLPHVYRISAVNLPSSYWWILSSFVEVLTLWDLTLKFLTLTELCRQTPINVRTQHYEFEDQRIFFFYNVWFLSATSKPGWKSYRVKPNQMSDTSEMEI